MTMLTNSLITETLETKKHNNHLQNVRIKILLNITHDKYIESKIDNKNHEWSTAHFILVTGSKLC